MERRRAGRLAEPVGRRLRGPRHGGRSDPSHRPQSRRHQPRDPAGGDHRWRDRQCPADLERPRGDVDRTRRLGAGAPRPVARASRLVRALRGQSAPLSRGRVSPVRGHRDERRDRAAARRAGTGRRSAVEPDRVDRRRRSGAARSRRHRSPRHRHRRASLRSGDVLARRRAGPAGVGDRDRAPGKAGCRARPRCDRLRCLPQLRVSSIDRRRRARSCAAASPRTLDSR